VSEIMVNGPDEGLHRATRVLTKADVRFEDENSCSRRSAAWLRLRSAHRWLEPDGRRPLPTAAGQRDHPPGRHPRAALTIRKFKDAVLGMENLTARAASARHGRVLEAAVLGRMNILAQAAHGSGQDDDSQRVARFIPHNRG